MKFTLCKVLSLSPIELDQSENRSKSVSGFTNQFEEEWLICPV